jgi:hypothetical protein
VWIDFWGLYLIEKISMIQEGISVLNSRANREG